MTEDEKNYIKLLFQRKVNIQHKQYICATDCILSGLDMTQYKKVVAFRSKLGRFYEALFAYLCNFSHPSKGFDLVDYKNNIYIELKSNWSTDNYDSKNSKFQKLVKHKAVNPTCEVIYACLNDNRRGANCDYMHEDNFRIIIGYKTWKYLCSFKNINVDELINFLRELVREVY